MNGQGEAGADPRTIERRSDAIRADMNQTLDALQRQVSPGALVDRGMDLFREHGGDLGANLGRSIRENPMPALLTLVGVGWMILSSRPSTAGAPVATGGDASGSMSTTGTMGDAGATSGGGIAGAVAPLADKLHDGRERVAERSRAAADAARERAQRANQGFQRLLDEQPLVVGALGIAAGALLGALVPESDRERELLGDARERAVAKAKDLGAQGYERARETATQAVAGASERLGGTSLQ
jgi:ElaB/YqjD/DUF883 family membrane-anchored ribosome-binding protein